MHRRPAATTHSPLDSSAKRRRAARFQPTRHPELEGKVAGPLRSVHVGQRFGSGSGRALPLQYTHPMRPCSPPATGAGEPSVRGGGASYGHRASCIVHRLLVAGQLPFRCGCLGARVPACSACAPSSLLAFCIRTAAGASRAMGPLLVAFLGTGDGSSISCCCCCVPWSWTWTRTYKYWCW